MPAIGIDPLVSRIPQTSRLVLELGAIDATLVRRYRAINPAAAWWVLCQTEEIARPLRDHADLVLIGAPGSPDVLAALDEALDGRLLDAVIIGDAAQLESSLTMLAARSHPESVWLTAFPNGGNAGCLRAALTDGRLPSQGVSKSQAAAAVSAAGMAVVDAIALTGTQDPGTVAALLPVAVAMGADPETAETRLQADRWVVRFCPVPPAAPLTVVALGLRKMAGVTEARVDYPLRALASLPGVTAAWGGGSVVFPKGAAPGIFLLHRQFLNAEPMISTVERMVAKGWTVVSEMDDDPHHWREYIESDFRAFRGVHAVTVSTNEMARMIRQWNPEVEIFPNQLPYLPEVPSLTPKSQGRLRLFFGALNRGADWQAVLDGLTGVALRHADQLEVVVVHDQAFFDALPAAVTRSFHPTLAHADYMTVLSSCDIALLPLADTPFNRLKSDLKLIECAGAGAVPICSRIVYAEEPEHAAFAVFADSPAQWAEALLDLLASPAEIRRRRDLGLDYARRRRLHSGDVARRHAYFQDLMVRRDALERERQIRIANLRTP